MLADFEIIASIDLADVNQNTHSVYQYLTQYRRDVFESQQRVVFYTNSKPSQDLLNHIQKAITLIDISNYFVLFCCPYNIKDMLNSARQLHGNDAVCMHWLEMFTVNAKPLKADQFVVYTEKLCPMPWMHVQVDNQGQYHTCCVYQGDMGSVADYTPQEFFNSDQLTDVRKRFLDGEKLSECSYCWNAEDHGTISNRQRHIKSYGKQFLTTWINQPEIKTIDFRPGNVCNFKCRICDPSNSSKVAEENFKFEKNNTQSVFLLETIKQGRWFDNNPKFIESLIELLPNIVNMDFYGGEPFLLKQLPTLLKRIVDDNHCDHIRLHFNTNGSVYPTQIINLLNQFQSIDIAISIDDIQQRFEYQRGGIWSEVEKNIIQMNQLTHSRFKVYIFTTVNIQNVLYLDKLYAWADSLGLEVVLNLLEFPKHLNIDFVTTAARDLIYQKYHNHSNIELQKIAQRIQHATGHDGIEFVSYMKTLDQRRNQNFSLEHQAIAIPMGYMLN